LVVIYYARGAWSFSYTARRGVRAAAAAVEGRLEKYEWATGPAVWTRACDMRARRRRSCEKNTVKPCWGAAQADLKARARTRERTNNQDRERNQESEKGREEEKRKKKKKKKKMRKRETVGKRGGGLFMILTCGPWRDIRAGRRGTLGSRLGH
jgi:hypothetical protein